MSRQSQYFESFKTQVHHKLRLAWDREQSLQNRIYTLEKQLLDMTVSAATGMATIGAVRITAGIGKRLEHQDRLPSLRGEGEGEEEKKEDRRKQWQPSMSTERKESQEGDVVMTETGVEGVQNRDTKHSFNEARLQGFIISLQEDLRVLLEREEDGMIERRGLIEQLQEAQEKSHFLGSNVEEMKAEMRQLKLTEISLMEEIEELREENQKLKQTVRDASVQTPPQSLTTPGSMSMSSGTSSPTCGSDFSSVPPNTILYTTAVEESSAGSLGEVCNISYLLSLLLMMKQSTKVQKVSFGFVLLTLAGSTPPMCVIYVSDTGR